ncbi:hypothetical protein [Streptomyces sp. NPDC057729]|uniref:hypothetical protein n=1 Tax=Streptomyces sp. NPDC057729 TaxID=3346230 RepID=UPI0036BC81DE
MSSGTAARRFRGPWGHQRTVEGGPTDLHRGPESESNRISPDGNDRTPFLPQPQLAGLHPAQYRPLVPLLEHGTDGPRPRLDTTSHAAPPHHHSPWSSRADRPSYAAQPPECRTTRIGAREAVHLPTQPASLDPITTPACFRQQTCHFESICESCTFFVTTIEFHLTLQRQRDDAAAKGQVAREQIFDGLLSRLDEDAS